MGRVTISCCGREIFHDYHTKKNESGIVRGRCGCVYEWRDVGSSKVDVNTNEICTSHSGINQKLVKCGRCEGTGTVNYGNSTCSNCQGSGFTSA